MSDRSSEVTPATSLPGLLAVSGGRPIIQIVLDLENDVTSIRSAGVDGAAIPALILRLGEALSGPQAPRRGSPSPS
jgi:hypothetical protein